MSILWDRTDTPTGADKRYGASDFGYTEKLANLRIDLRAPEPDDVDRFIDDNVVRDWSLLSWDKVGRPFRVENYASGLRQWEEENGDTMPVSVSWQKFNRSFHEWFVKDVPAESKRVRKQLASSIASLHFAEIGGLMQELQQLSLWNLTHRIQDAVWDPRGKRALFRGLDVANTAHPLPWCSRRLRSDAIVRHVPGR